MSHKRWIYLAAVGLSVIAFIVDRVFLGEPESVSADVLETTTTTSESDPNSPDDQAEIAVTTNPTINWLEELPEAAGAVRDVFALSGGFLAHRRKAQQETEQAEQAGWILIRYELIKGTYHFMATFAKKELFPIQGSQGRNR